jgi:hypothetical protein
MHTKAAEGQHTCTQRLHLTVQSCLRGSCLASCALACIAWLAVSCRCGTLVTAFGCCSLVLATAGATYRASMLAAGAGRNVTRQQKQAAAAKATNS